MGGRKDHKMQKETKHSEQVPAETIIDRIGLGET